MLFTFWKDKEILKNGLILKSIIHLRENEFALLRFQQLLLDNAMFQQWGYTKIQNLHEEASIKFTLIS